MTILLWAYLKEAGFNKIFYFIFSNYFLAITKNEFNKHKSNIFLYKNRIPLNFEMLIPKLFYEHFKSKCIRFTAQYRLFFLPKVAVLYSFSQI